MCNVQPMLGHTAPTAQCPVMPASFAEYYFAGHSLSTSWNLIKEIEYEMFCFSLSLNSESFDLQHGLKMIYHVLDSGLAWFLCSGIV